KLREAFVPALDAAAVVGTMRNIVTNRINAQLDLAGPSFSVSAEEASGVVPLSLAATALSAGEVHAGVVGAVDLSHDPVHRAGRDPGAVGRSGAGAPSRRRRRGRLARGPPRASARLFRHRPPRCDRRPGRPSRIEWWTLPARRPRVK